MILLTGPRGILGTAFLSYAKSLKNPLDVLAVTRELCDLSDEKAVEKLFSSNKNIGAVIHAAGFTDVDGCEKNGDKAWKDNALSTKNLAIRCGQYDTPFIYVSTDYVFNGQKNSLYSEDDATAPVNIYGMTKLAGESFAAQYAKRYAIVRTSWLYGSRVNPKNFVDAMLNNLKTKAEVGALDDQSDSPTYAPDLSQAIGKIAVALSQDKPVPRVLQFCNSGVTTRLEMTREMAKLLGNGVKVNRVDPSTIPNRVAVRPSFAAMSVRRYEEFFGLKVRPWQEALADYVKASA